MDSGRMIAGRYRLVEKIGSGGMGAVWRADDEQDSVTVALKRALAPDTATDRRLRREASLAAQVRHPDVVTVLDTADDGDDLWLVMEYVPARSLAETLRGSAPQDPAAVARLGVRLAGALAAVHACDIVHRDVSPANVLVTDDGTVKLTDFGISRSVSGNETLTESYVVGGTPGYLAPEVANGHEPTAASDVFSLGATLYAAVEGMAPFASDNPFASLRRAAAGDIPAPSRAGVLEPVLAELMAIRPERRPTAALAVSLLRAAAQGRGLPNRRRRRRVLAVGGALLVGALVAAGAVVLTSTDAPPPAPPALTLGPATERAVDPCGFADQAPMRRFGETRLDPAYGGYNRCDVLIEPAGGADEVDVSLELDVPTDTGDLPSGTPGRIGSFAISTAPPEDDRCQETLAMAGSYRLIVAAKQDRPGGVDLCAVARTATTSAAGVLDATGPPRRSTEFPQGSLAGADACSLLDPASLSRFAGLTRPTATPGFGDWGCEWSEPDGRNAVIMRFDRGIQTPPDNGSRERLGDRDAYVLADEDNPESCQVDVTHRNYTDASGATAAEEVQVVLDGEQPGPVLCAPATELARTVVPALPRV